MSEASRTLAAPRWGISAGVVDAAGSDPRRGGELLDRGAGPGAGAVLPHAGRLARVGVARDSAGPGAALYREETVSETMKRPILTLLYVKKHDWKLGAPTFSQRLIS